MTNDTTQRKRTVRNIVLVPYKPKPKDWGSWKIQSPYTTSAVASPILDIKDHPQNSNQDNEDNLAYVHTVLIMSQCTRHSFMKMNKMMFVYS